MKNYAKKSLNASNGITLIALVITIIVLLILAGISISMLSGDNGLLTKAGDAKTQTGIGQEKETIALAYNSALIKKVNKGDSLTVNADDMNIEFQSEGTNATAVDGTNNIKITFDSGNTYIIDSNGNVEPEIPENKPNIPELKVGDFVNYTLKIPTTEELTKLNNDLLTYSGATDNTEKTSVGSTLLCRVLEVDSYGKPTKLISANGVNSLSLYGANGYNNAVYLINEMCTTLYSGNQGTTTSLTIDDLENRYFSSAAITTRDSYTSYVQYGQTQYYSGSNNAKYPSIASEEARMGIATTIVNGKNTIRSGGLGLSEQEIPYTGFGDANASSVASTNKGITVTQTFYQINAGESSYKNATLNNIMHNCPTASSDTEGIMAYWLASRMVQARNNDCVYNVRFVITPEVTWQGMFGSSYNSDGVGVGFSYSVRPVINLNSGIQTEYIESYNSTYNLWNLN